MSTSHDDKMHLRLSALETRMAVDEVHRCNVSDRLRAIEDTLKWVVRLIVGALIMATIAFAVQGGFSLPVNR